MAVFSSMLLLLATIAHIYAITYPITPFHNYHSNPKKAHVTCGENKTYTRCGTTCQLTCDNYQNPLKWCPKNCFVGCVCLTGLVKTRDGRCVRPEECPATDNNLLIPEVCGENKVFNSCGTACPLTCDNYQNPPEICTLQCVTGCECLKDFVKTSDGRCIRPEECPAPHDNLLIPEVCGENKVFNSCGTACPLTCDNYQNPPEICTLQCVTGCECLKGFVKTRDGRCVRPEECPATDNNLLIPEVCGENKVFNRCGTACPLTCDNYQNPPKWCSRNCVIGCECLQGFVKTRNGKCVRPEECPATDLSIPDVCGENRVFNSCGTACPLTCDNYQNPPEFCTLQCVTGCECLKGFFRTRDGRCVRPEECPVTYNNLLIPEVCGENKVFNSCGTACPLTCDNYQKPTKYQNPPKWCTKNCVIGCECLKGFVKTRDGRCVRPEECPATDNNLLIPEVCGENKVFNSCGTACPLTCDNYQNPPKWCTLQCVTGCECLKGFVKTRDGRCVRPQECPVTYNNLFIPDCCIH